MIWEFDIDPGNRAFLYTNAMVNMMAFCFLVLFLQGASAQLSFASDNRSTKPRITMLIQTSIFVAWMCGITLAVQNDDVAIAACICLGIYWAIMGALLSGEIDTLSPRVRRSLPQTGLGRVLGTWFTPGGSTGYLFSISTLAVAIGTVVLAYSMQGAAINDEVYVFALLIVLYAVSYLGATRIILRSTSRWTHPGPLGSLVITITLLVFGTILPTICQLLAWRVFGDDYTMLQAPNWAWSLAASLNSRSADSVAGTGIVMAGVSIVLLLTHLMIAAKQVGQHHMSAPKRVREEEESEKPRTNEPTPAHPLDIGNE